LVKGFTLLIHRLRKENHLFFIIIASPAPIQGVPQVSPTSCTILQKTTAIVASPKWMEMSKRSEDGVP